VDKLLKNHDIILPKKRNYIIETNYSHYIHAHHSEPLKKVRNIIKEYHSDYLNSFDLIMNKRKAHMFNMFIMKNEFFNAYAEWLFSILGKLEIELNIENYSDQEARVFGYISELLMDVWVNKNNINYVEARWSMLGKKHNLNKAFNLLKRKFLKIDSDNSKTHF